MGIAGETQIQAELRFPLRFVALAAAMGALWAGLRPLWPAFQTGTANLVAFLSTLVGPDATATASARVRFFSDGRTFQFVISDGCTGFTLIAIFVVAVMAFPATSRQRSTGLLIGVPVLFALNLARLLMLGWVGLRSQQSFAALHEFWWPAIQVAVAGLGWFAWVRLVVERRGPIPEAIVGRSHQIATVLVFAGVFTTLGVVGFWGHGMDLYGQLLRVPLGLAVKLLWPTTFALHDVPADRVLHSYGLHYALFTAVVALFMASPGIAWRKRLRGLLTTGIPIVMGLQVGVVLTLLSITVAGRGGGGGAERFFESWCNSVFVAAHAGLALIVWHGWATRARCRALQRQARRTRRRQTSKR